MKRFAFSLQSVLRLREFYKEEAEMELAHAINKSDQIKFQLQENAKNKVFANQSRSCAQLNAMIAIENYIQRLDLNTEELLEQAAAAELVVEAKRKILAEKMKDSKVLTNLKDRRHLEYRKENLKAEDIVVDDMVNSSSYR